MASSGEDREVEYQPEEEPGDEFVVVARSYTAEGAREAAAFLGRNGIDAYHGQYGFAVDIFAGADMALPSQCVSVAPADAEGARSWLESAEELEISIAYDPESRASIDEPDDEDDALPALAPNLSKRALMFGIVSMVFAFIGPFVLWYVVRVARRGVAKGDGWRLLVAFMLSGFATLVLVVFLLDVLSLPIRTWS